MDIRNLTDSERLNLRRPGSQAWHEFRGMLPDGVGEDTARDLAKAVSRATYVDVNAARELAHYQFDFMAESVAKSLCAREDDADGVARWVLKILRRCPETNTVQLLRLIHGGQENMRDFFHAFYHELDRVKKKRSAGA